jgi:hypothetical protein
MGILSLIVTVKIAQTFSNDLWMETSGGQNTNMHNVVLLNPREGN